MLLEISARLFCMFNNFEVKLWYMPFSYNSRLNIGEREGHLKTTLKKLVFFTSM
jgi:hypothetical protein